MAATDVAPAGPQPLLPRLSDASLVSLLLCTASQTVLTPSSLRRLSYKFSSVNEAVTPAFDRSDASSTASGGWRPLLEKLARVWSGLMPHNVVKCGLSLATVMIVVAASTSTLLLSRLRASRVSIRGSQSVSILP